MGTGGEDEDNIVFQAELKGDALMMIKAETDDERNLLPNKMHTVARVEAGTTSGQLALVRENMIPVISVGMSAYPGTDPQDTASEPQTKNEKCSQRPLACHFIFISAK